MTEGSFEVKLPTYGQMQQQMWEKLETRESVERRSIKVREKVEKSRNTAFFQCFAAPEARKVGSLKRRVQSDLAGWEINNCTRLWREARFEVKHLKGTPSSDHFWTSLFVSGTMDSAPWQKCIFAGQAQCKRHLHQICSEVRALISWDGLHFGASDPQVC